VKLHPDSVWGQVRLASHLIKANDLVEGFKVVQSAQKIEPDRWDSYICLGLLAAKTGDLAGAVTNFRMALAGNPKHGPSHFLLAWAYDKQGKLEEARDEYRMALLYNSLLSSEDKATVLRAIADINEKLPDK
jgi:Flp pilus assembly protein TadD